MHTEGSASFLGLPNELLDHVFAHLDTSSPLSISTFQDLPSLTSLDSPNHPLKTVSLLSHRLRAIVQTRLFTHIRFDYYAAFSLLHFLDQSSLSATVQSVVVCIQEAIANPAHLSWWLHLLNKCPNASRILIQCKPEFYPAVANVEVNLFESWAFKVPCQYVELERYNSNTAEATSESWSLASRQYPWTDVGLFAAQHWRSLKINEGSSLAAYTTYEYFLKKPPSLLASLQHYLNIVPLDAGPVLYTRMFASRGKSLMAASAMIANLREFSYIAVFPFYNHVDDILKCVRRMQNLRRLFMKLCPVLGSTVLEDEVQAAKGHIDLNDPWSEVSIGYILIADAVRTLGNEAQLETFTTGDLSITGIRETLESDVSERLVDTWVFDKIDTWTKKARCDAEESDGEHVSNQDDGSIEDSETTETVLPLID